MKKIIPLILLAAVLTGCSEFTAPFEHVQASKKTRPMSVVVEPAEAAPGDTVQVTFYTYSPDPASYDATWQMELDYTETKYGGETPSGKTMDLEPVMFDEQLTTDAQGLVVQSFKVQIPGSLLAVSSAVPQEIDVSDIPEDVKPLLGIPAGAQTITNAQFDAILSSVAIDLSLFPPEMQLLVDTYCTMVRFKASVDCERTLTVTRTMPVRYSHALGSDNTNTNPALKAMAVIKVDADITDWEDIGKHDNDTIVLYHRDMPSVERDTVLVDKDCSYFLFYDFDPVDTYNYWSVAASTDPVYKTDGEEEYFARWLFTNLDASSEPDDSLIIMIGEDAHGNGSRLLPPVATDMHNFRLYLLVRDDRPEWGVDYGVGTAFIHADGYFKYTEEYIAAHKK